MYRNTYASINGDILKRNIKEIKKHYPDYQYYIGVVKANAYGHGDYIVKNLIEGGVNYLAVSSLEEALSIRKQNAEISILCLEPIHIDYLDICSKNNITITIDSYEYFSLLKKITFSLKVHIKLDTGMNRLGIKEKEEFLKILKEVKEKTCIEIEGIYTHFATQGIHDVYWDKQYEKFKSFLKDVDLSKIKIIHMGRSLTLVNHKKPDFINGIRLGIIMYGFSQSISFGGGIVGKLKKMKRNVYLKRNKISETILTNQLKLKTAFSLYSEVIAIKDAKMGDIVGYSGTYQAPCDMKVAILPIGYADGMNSKFKEVVIQGQKYPIIGEVCMDMTMIKVDDKVAIYDKVEIFGDVITVKEAAIQKGVNVYQLFISITSRVPRVYLEKEEEIEIKY